MQPTAESQMLTLQKHLEIEGNRALTKGAFYSTLLGLAGGAIVLGLILFEAAENMLSPCIFAFVGAGYSYVVYLLARSERMKGWITYVAFVPFVSLPTFFFLLSHFFMPAGSATFITGPISYLYFHFIIMTGFLFDPKLSILAGLVSAAGYMWMYFLGREYLAQISTPDPTLTQDFNAVSIYSIKAFMMAFGGVVVAALSVIAKRLIIRVLEEEQQKTAISKLFGQYVSPRVKEKIISEKSGTIGERKQVVVLFSDLRGFSTYSEGREPEAIVSHLNEYFDSMVKSINKHCGVVDKFIGDAIMAVFGGVIDLENPAESACLAAQDMRLSLEKMNRGWDKRGWQTLENGIGMHLGEVLQGSIGSVDRKEFTVIGDTVNTASRLEGLTKNYDQKILVTEAFHRALPESLAAGCQSLGRVKVKGKQEEIPIFGVQDQC